MPQYPADAPSATSGAIHKTGYLRDTARVAVLLGHIRREALPRLNIEPDIAALADQLIAEEIDRRNPRQSTEDGAAPAAAYRDHDAAMIVHQLAQLYLQYADTRRALVLLLIANRIAPTNILILRTLAEAFLARRDGVKAYSALSHIEQIQGPSSALARLQSRALWCAGYREQAKTRFRESIDLARQS